MLSASGSEWLQPPDRLEARTSVLAMNVSVAVPFIDHCVYRVIIHCDPILQTISCHRVLCQAKNVSTKTVFGWVLLRTLYRGAYIRRYDATGPHNRQERGITPDFLPFDAFGASIERARKSLRVLNSFQPPCCVT